MKFYYNDKLVRTSKHNYKFACINTENQKIVQCSETREGAMREINRRASEKREVIENCNRAIKAIENGKSYYFIKDGRREYRLKFEDVQNPSRESYEQEKQDAFEWLNWYTKAFEVVELEARA